MLRRCGRQALPPSAFWSLLYLSLSSFCLSFCLCTCFSMSTYFSLFCLCVPSFISVSFSPFLSVSVFLSLPYGGHTGFISIYENAKNLGKWGYKTKKPQTKN